MTTNADDEIGRIFGEDAASFVPVLFNVVRRFKNHRYEFISQVRYGQLLQTDLGEAMRIYWLEILYRAHFASSASLLRSKRWVEGMIAAIRDENYTVFMASLRGFLEAAADSFYSLQDVPSLLAESHTIIRKAIGGCLGQRVLSPDLENTLIHFTHARSVDRNEEAPRIHRKMQTKEYIASLAIDENQRFAELYSHVCEVTHPASSSVMCYVKRNQDTAGTLYELVSQPDSELIRQIGQSYRDVMLRIISLGTTPPLIILRLLNEFPVASLHTEAVTNVGIEGRYAWKEIWSRLRDPAPPATRPATPADGAV